LELLLRRANPWFVFPAAAQLHDVIPGAHPHALVDRHRAYRRVRKNEAHGETPGKPQFRHDRLEIMAVGSQPVQPDHRGIGLRAGFDFNRFKGLCHPRIVSVGICDPKGMQPAPVLLDTTPHIITSLLALGMALAFIIADRSSPTSRALSLFLAS